MQDRLYSLEGLRGVMALWVVIGHALSLCGLEFSNKILSITISPGHAVTVFIILSGFVIAMVLDSKYHGWKQYMLRRSMRIFPVYIVCLVLSVLCVDLTLSILRDLPWAGHHNGARIGILMEGENNFLYHLISHLTMTHGLIPHSLLPQSSWTFMEQAWSLTLELQFYILALLIPYTQRSLRRKLIAITILFVLMFLGQTAIQQSSFIGKNFYLFLSGITSYYIYKQRERLGKELTITYLLLIGIFVISVDWVNFIGMGIWLITLISEIYYKKSKYITLLSSTKVVSLGVISYSVYCSHMLVLYAVILLFTAIGVSSGILAFIGCMVVGIPLILIFSHFLYLSIEKPMICVSKKY